MPVKDIAVNATLDFDKSRLLSWLGLAAVAALYGWTSGLTDYPGPNSDSLVYIYHAVWYSGGGEQWLSDFVRGSPFPPGFPLWLSVFGAAPENVTAAVVANSIACIISLAAFSVLARTYGITGFPNLALCLVTYLGFYFFSFTRSVGSEGLYMAFSFGALAWLRTVDATASRQKLTAIALMVGTAYLVRSIGFLLIVAYVANEIRYRRLQLLPALVMLVPIVCWAIVTNVFFDGGRSYVAQFLGLNPIENLPAWISTNVAALTAALEHFTGWHKLLAIALFLAVMANVARRTWSLDPVAIYFLAYLLVLLLWPYPSHMDRLFLPLWPLCVLLLFDLIRFLRPLSKGWKTAMAGTLGIAMLAGSIIRFVEVGGWELPEHLEKYRYTTPIMAQRSSDDAARLADHLHRGIVAATETARFVGPDQCVSSIVPHFVSFYSRRRVARIMLGAPHNETMWKVSVCPFVFVLNLESNSWEGSLFYPVNVPLEKDHFTPLMLSETEDGKIAAALFAYGERVEAASN